MNGMPGGTITGTGGTATIEAAAGTQSYFRMPRGMRGAPGFTLVEVVFSLAILAMALVALISACFGVVAMNKRVEQRMNAMSLVNEQLGEMLAAAGGGSAFEEADNSPAKAFLLGMRNRMEYLENLSPSADFPYRVTLDQNAGALVYEFAVPVSGRRRPVMTDPVADIMNRENRNSLARGVVVAYLRENAVPRQFLDWADVDDGGRTPWPHNWFPMGGPGSTGNNNYANLVTSSNPDWERSELQNLPLLLSVRYYDTEAQMNADVLVPPPGDNILEYGTATVCAGRMFLVASNRFAL